MPPAPQHPSAPRNTTPRWGHPSSYACCCQPGVSQRDPFGILGTHGTGRPGIPQDEEVPVLVPLLSQG